MEAISGTQEIPTIQPDIPTTSESQSGSATAATAAKGADFESFLKASVNLGAGNQVSEEALFASLVEERVQTLKGEEAGKKYLNALDSHKASARKSDGFIPLEDAAKGALKELREGGVVSRDEADKIYSEAFLGAQLDDNAEALFDDRGGPGDTTVAVAPWDEALKSSRTTVDKLKSGELTATLRSLDESSVGNSPLVPGQLTLLDSGGLSSGGGSELIKPKGTTFDGKDGFLFKPVSENQGTVAVLLPEVMKGAVSGVMLMNAAGEILDDGRSTGFGDQGVREKFSFSRPGSDYGKNLTVRVQFLDGTMTDFSIPDPSLRYD